MGAQGRKNTATSIQAAGSLFQGIGAYKQADTNIKAVGRSIAGSRQKSRMIIERARLLGKGMTKHAGQGRSTAQTAAAGQGFGTTSAGRQNIDVDYASQLATDMEALDRETTYELMLEEANRREMQMEQDQQKKAKRGAMVGTVLGVAGTIAGSYGGPGGAAAGGTAGYSIGSYLGQL